MTAVVESNETKEMTAQFRMEGDELLAQAERAEVVTVDQAEKMTDLLKIVKTKKTKSEEARKSLVQPLNDHVRYINGEFKKAQQPLDSADRVGRQKLNSFQREQERIRLEEEARIRKAEEERRLAEAAKAEAAGDNETAERVLNEVIPTAPKQAPTRGNFGSSGTRKVWQHRLVDKSKVPGQYLMVDDKAVRAAINSGVRDIPGLEIIEEITTVIR